MDRSYQRPRLIRTRRIAMVRVTLTTLEADSWLYHRHSVRCNFVSLADQVLNFSPEEATDRRACRIRAQNNICASLDGCIQERLICCPLLGGGHRLPYRIRNTECICAQYTPKFDISVCRSSEENCVTGFPHCRPCIEFAAS